MGLLCDVCEKVPGTVYCFADRALMCSACDMRVHSANKLARKHDRVSVTLESEPVPCDICQEEKAVMFCPEERAVTCRRCDIMIHTANEFTAKHRRSLLSTSTIGLDSLPAPGEASSLPVLPAHHLKTGGKRKEQETSTSSGSPLGNSADDISHSAGRSRKRRGMGGGAELTEGQGDASLRGSAGQLLDSRMGSQADDNPLIANTGFPGGLQQPYSNGNGAFANGNAYGNASGSGYPGPMDLQPSPFQMSSGPLQDTYHNSHMSMQHHQPGGAGQPDGMFTSNYPPGTGTSNPAGFEPGGRAPSIGMGMWRASSTNSGGMTLAAELLGVPLPDEYSAKDIDAAYMMGDDGDLDADLSALLEVPDLNSQDLASLGPSMAPSAFADYQGASSSGQADGVVPDMSQAGPSKRSRR